MSNTTCKAKDPSKCPYHGAVLRVEATHSKIMVYVANKEPIPSDLFEAYSNAKAEVDLKIAEGWDEDAFAQLWKDPNSTVTVTKEEKNEPQVSQPPTKVQPAPTENNNNVPSSNSSEAIRVALPKVSTIVDGETVVFERADLYDLNRVPKYVRLQFHAPLSKTARTQFASILQYSLKVAFKAPTADFQAPTTDSGYSFIVPLEALKEKKEVDKKLVDFGRMVKTFVREGTPKRPSRNNTRRYEKVKADNSHMFKMYFAPYGD